MIVFEGPDGSGKSTTMKLVSEKMRDMGIEHISVRNPGGTPSGEAIRELILNPHFELDPMAQVYLFVASRIQLMEERVKPALMAGQMVLCDRLELSTIFYQTAGFKWELIRKYGNVPEVTSLVMKFHQRLKEINGGVTDDIELRYIITDASNTTLNKRRPPNMEDRFEMKGETFQKDVRAFYRHHAESHSWDSRIRTINTDQPLLHTAISSLIQFATLEATTCPTKVTA
jgi:dTMP kinase